MVSISLAAEAWAQQSGMHAAENTAANAVLTDAPEVQVAQQGSTEITVQGGIHGVVVNRDGAVYEGAKIALSRPEPTAGSEVQTGAAWVQSTMSDSEGRFNFANVPPGPFRLTVSSTGFATQVVTGTLHAGENYEAKAIVLTMSGTISDVVVTASPQEIAQEQLKQEETQRVLGVIPNFYVTYVPNAPPLTSKQKFNLAWKSSIDPVTFLAVGFFAGVEQATNSYSGYGQGAQGYGKRYGAGFADSFLGTMIGGAILPSWWKQDPRYFYKGTGTTRSRMMYALENAVICKGDNGRWQVNYSAIVGGIAAGGISNLYYPAASRDGAELTFLNVLIGTGESAVGNLFQEFVIRRLTPRVPNYGNGKP
ncbi:MAG: carboxypeptidase-like regulatory domain-containing protein [Terracidiphilus sp.]